MKWLLRHFLNEKIGFMQMPDIVEYTMENSLYSHSLTLIFLKLQIISQGDSNRIY